MRPVRALPVDRLQLFDDLHLLLESAGFVGGRSQARHQLQVAGRVPVSLARVVLFAHVCADQEDHGEAVDEHDSDGVPGEGRRRQTC